MSVAYSNDSFSETSSVESVDWIQEEELLVKYAECDSFELVPLSQIKITFIYVDRTQDVVESADEIIDLTISANHSIVEWSILKRAIEAASSLNGLRYRFNEVAYYHNSVTCDNLDLFRPTSSLTKIEREIDCKISSSLPAFHDISQIFIIMREVIPAPIGQSLKSILKSGSKIGKTKRVRISEPTSDIFGPSSSRKTRKQW